MEEEEAASPSILRRGEPRVVAVQVVDLCQGKELVKSLLAPVLEPVEKLCIRVQEAAGTKQNVQIFKDLAPVRSDALVRSLTLQHHDRVLCSVGPVKHDARCMRCKQAPIVGTRHHVAGYSVDLCSKHAVSAPASIKQLLTPLYVPHIVHDGIVSTHGCPTTYSDWRAWLCSVDGPYTTRAEIDEALKNGATLFKGEDGHLVWIWSRDANGFLKTGSWPRHL